MKNFNLKKTIIPKFIILLLFHPIKIHIIKKPILKYISILLCVLFSTTNLWSQLPVSCNFRFCSYEVVPGYPKEIKYNGQGIPDLSGVTYHAEKLFMVTNKPTNIYQTDLFGNVERKIILSGSDFDDTEGIVHIGETRFAVSDEEFKKIIFFDILSSTSSISNGDNYIKLPNELGPWGIRTNKSLEGVSYDPVTNTIYTVKEGGPDEDDSQISKGFYSFLLPESLPVTLEEGEVNRPCGTNSFGLVDFSDVFHLGHAYPNNTGVLLLSHKSKKIVYIDGCEIKGEFSLDFMCQPEGITMDNNGDIYVVGEYDNLECVNLGKSNEFVILRRNHDVNNDGLVNILDAQNVAQASIGLKTVSDICNVLPPNTLCQPRTDMDCNGEINVLDAYNIARLAVELCPN